MIKWLFGVAPKVGSVWKLHDLDPFGKDIRVKVLAVKRGWVQYTNDFENEYANSPPISTTVRVFRDLYREL